MDAAGRVTAIIITAIMMILTPLQYIAQLQAEAAGNTVNTLTAEFNDTARHQGYLTDDMYDEYLEKLSVTGDSYDVEMKISHPVFTKDLASENENSVHKAAYDKTSSDIKSLSLSTDSSHMHTDACYKGILHVHGASCYTSYSIYHVHTGNSTSGGGCYGTANYHSHSAGCYSSVTCGTAVAPTYLTSGYYLCRTCGKNVLITTYARTCSSCGHIYGTATGSACGHIPAPSSFTCTGTVNELTCTISTSTPSSYSLNCGKTESTIERYTSYLTCGKTEGYYYDSSGSMCLPVCNKVVTSISATAPTQTVEIGNSIITTATATYLDGHTETVDCTVSGFDASKTGIQTVTFTYSEYEKPDGSYVSCTVTVLVKPNLISISALPSPQNVTRYTNYDLTVTAIYQDNTAKTVTNYTVTGFNNTVLGTQTVTVFYTENGITKTTTVQINITRLTTACPICGAEYELDENDTDQGCPICTHTVISISATPDNVTVNKGEGLGITVTAAYRNGISGVITGWTSNYNANLVGVQSVKISYGTAYTYLLVTVRSNTKICGTCGVEYDLNEDGSDPGCPYCAEEVVSISASPKNLTVGINDPVNLTVTATYRDGHREVVDGWYTNFIPETAGIYEISVYYKKASDKISVTVVDGMTTCSYCGLVYDRSVHGDGCPVCSTTLTGIEAGLRDGGTQVRYRAALKLEITLIYKDTHSELTYTGWTVSGYQADVLGEQTITIHYGGFDTSLIITVVDNAAFVTCPVCSTQYYLNEDGTDSGCPVCTADAKVKEAVLYFDVTYSHEILTSLYKDGIYYLKEGDYFTIAVTSLGEAMYKRIQKLIPGTGLGMEAMRRERYICGGEVIT